MTNREQLSGKQQEIYESLKEDLDGKLRELAVLLDVQQQGELFGEREIRLRELLQELGRQAVETAADDPKKGVPRC